VQEREPADPGETSAAKFDRYAASYTELHGQNVRASGESPEYFSEYKVRCLLRCGAPADAPLLDWGCGIGNVTASIAASFRDVHAYDPSAASLDVVGRRLPQVRRHAVVEDIPAGAFTTVVMSGVLHHVPPDARADLLGEVRNRLRPGGRLFVFEHNPFNPLTRRAVATCPFDDDAILLWPREARRLLASAGFDALRLDYIVFFPRRLAWLRRFEPSMRWFLLGAQFMLIGRRPDA
jgi:SAM-dependent methyltransferase